MNTISEKTESPPTKTQPQSIMTTLTITCGSIAILLSFWAGMLLALLAGRQFVILSHIEGYKPAEFTVEKLVYFHGMRPGRSRIDKDHYWAEGTINGQPEKFTLGAYLPKIPANQAQLESMMSVGRVLPVLYNPEVPDTIEVRIIYPEEDFPAKWLLRRRNMYKYGFGPLAIALGFCLLCSLADRSWLGLKFFVGSLPFPLMGWLFAWLDLSA
ncbi:MAG: hypothetical protein KKB30_12665 [Proteobacteria bacterium]|nr:hypothetical protein [Pseudomonadota bacterium]MBU1714634.1 hypothetical protein [Pseudomonadota bacterium]